MQKSDDLKCNHQFRFPKIQSSSTQLIKKEGENEMMMLMIIYKCSWKWNFSIFALVVFGSISRFGSSAVNGILKLQTFSSLLQFKRTNVCY